MSRESLGLKYTGFALEAGLMDVRDLAPALLAFGDLCEQANYEVNGTQTRASVQIKGVAPGSFTIIFVVSVTPLAAVATLLGLKFATDPLGTAKEVLDLVKSGIDLVKTVIGKDGKIVSATQIADGITQLTIVHTGTIEQKVTHDISDRLYSYISRRSVQRDYRDMVAPLKSEGIDGLKLQEGGAVVESITTDDIATFDALPALLPNEREELKEQTSTIDKWLTVVTISSDGRSNWRLTDGKKSYSVKVDNHALLEAAKEGRSGIEPGFTVLAKIQTVTRWVSGEPDTENHLLAILDRKPPELRQEDGPQLF